MQGQSDPREVLVTLGLTVAPSGVLSVHGEHARDRPAAIGRDPGRGPAVAMRMPHIIANTRSLYEAGAHLRFRPLRETGRPALAACGSASAGRPARTTSKAPSTRDSTMLTPAGPQMPAERTPLPWHSGRCRRGDMASPRQLPRRGCSNPIRPLTIPWSKAEYIHHCKYLPAV
jgi:hypothetical protein